MQNEDQAGSENTAAEAPALSPARYAGPINPAGGLEAPGISYGGWLLAAVGAIAMFGAAALYDPTVESSALDTYSTSRIYNNGRMQTQMMWFIFGAASFVSGNVMLAASSLYGLIRRR